MNLRGRLKGLAAAALIAGLLVGLPWLLLQLGWPSWPERLTLSDVWRFLTSPDDGTLALSVIKVLAWLAWAALVLLILIEVAARLRRLEPPSLPGLGGPQAAVRSLVAAAALLFVASSQVSSTTAALASQPPAVTATAQPAPRTAHPAAHPEAATGTVRYAVQPGDSLWQIAEAQLGDGHRFREIVALNANLLHRGADFLRPGWVLTLPADPNTVIVARGDTLSSIARTHFDGDETKAQQIFDASTALAQPHGGQLTDPDLIYPGWQLHLHPEAADAQDAGAQPVAPAAPPASQPAPVTPQPADQAQAPAAQATPHDIADAPSDDEASDTDQPAWLLFGLTGGGAVLAGTLFRALRQRRAAQFRARRPGRLIAGVPAELVPVEKTLLSVGAAAAPTVEALDAVLRNLARDTAAANSTAPSLAAVELAPGHLKLHLDEPTELPAPWRGDDSNTHWQLDSADVAATAANPDPDAAAPYPQLVTLGTTEDGTTWLLNAEQFGSFTLTGDDSYTADFARSLIAEFTLNAWARDLQVDCLGLGQEFAGLAPDRLVVHHDDAVLDEVLQHAQTTRTDLDGQPQPNLAAARVTAADDQLWPSRVVIAALADRRPITDLDQAVLAHPGRTATSVFLLSGSVDEVPGVELRLSAGGRLELPAFGLDLIAVGLTSAEAESCAALLQACEDLQDVPMPPMPAQDEPDWRASCNQAGQLLPDLTLPREPATEDDEPVEASSVLDAPDADYLQQSATTPEDLETLAPRVPATVRDDVARLDPHLDADVDAWFADPCRQPRLSVLGPVHLRLGAGGKPTKAARRKAFYLELAAYLAMHPQGVSTDQLAQAMKCTTDRVRKDMSVLRAWLGIDPATGRPHVPDSVRSTAAHQRGVRLYQMESVLTDADLFRRLRVRGESRGVDGLPDLRLALRLVTGRPFDQFRDSGGTWLAGEERHDHILAAAIVDVAHVVAVAALHAQEYAHARAAAEIASMAAPYDEIPNLDLAAIAAAEGRFHDADRILRQDVCNRSDDGQAPTELSERTARIVASHSWLRGQRAAG